jgi:hypothetical protein
MTDASVSFAGNLTDDPEVRHTERGILDLTEQMRAGPVVDLPVHRRVEQTTAGAALPQGDPTGLAVAPQGEGAPSSAVSLPHSQRHRSACTSDQYSSLSAMNALAPQATQVRWAALSTGSASRWWVIPPQRHTACRIRSAG